MALITRQFFYNFERNVANYERVEEYELPKGKIHRVDPDFGSTSAASNRDSQSNCWVNWKSMGQPCEFQVRRRRRQRAARRPARR